MTQPSTNGGTPASSGRTPAQGNRLDPWYDVYADRALNLRASEIRALFSVVSRPEVVSLAGGMPNLKDLPLDRLAASAEKLIRNHGAQAMQYGSGQGWEVLREVSERTGIPVVLTTGRRPFLEEFLRDGRDARFTGEAMPLEPYMLRSPDNFAHGKI